MEDTINANPTTNIATGQGNSEKRLFEAAKEIPIEQVIKRYVDVSLIPNGSNRLEALCPFHNETDASFNVYLGTNSFHCFGCHVGGSNIDLIMEARGIDPLHAAKTLVTDFQISCRELTPEEVTKYEKNERKTVLLKDYILQSHKNIRQEHKEALYKRGLTDNEIKQYQIGYDPGKNLTGTEELKAIGLFNDKGSYLPANRIIIPIWEYGKPIHLIFWEPSGKEPKYLFPCNTEKPLVGVDCLKKVSDVYLVEGVFDWFSMMKIGLPTVCSLGTHLSERQFSRLGRARQIYIAFDADRGGIEAGETFAKDLYPKTKLLRLPNGKDPNELYCHNPSEFPTTIHKITAEAKDAIELVLEECAKLDHQDGHKVSALVATEIGPLVGKLNGATQDVVVNKVYSVLKEFGIRKGSIREALRDEEGKETDTPSSDNGGPSKADEVVELVLDSGAELFHTPDGKLYATVPVENHQENWPLRSTGFKLWVQSVYFDLVGKGLRPQVFNDALPTLEAKARYKGQEHPVFIRIGAHEGNIYIDLCNEKWEVVEVTPAGWKVINNPPVRFVRTNGMRPLPHPATGGSIEELWRFVNVKNQQDRILTVSWLIAALRPTGPYPVLDVQGEQGSAKSTNSEVFRNLVDPSKSPLRSLPRDERDLVISAHNSWVLCFDNVSYLHGWLSDALCRLATRGGFSTRQLYTDTEEVIFDGTRPIILNGIHSTVEREDLRDRAIILSLPPIQENEFIPEEEFWKLFEDSWPRIFGALLDGVVTALRNRPNIKLDTPTRMADFAYWASAAEPAFGWQKGAFISAYTAKRQAVIEEGLEHNMLAQAIMRLSEKTPQWEGNYKNLLEALNDQVSEEARKVKEWPKSTNWLSNRLKRITPLLRSIGIEVVTLGTRDHCKWVKICTNCTPSTPNGENTGRKGETASLVIAPEDVQSEAQLMELLKEMELLAKYGVVERSTLVRACMDDYPGWSAEYILNLLTEGEGRFWEKRIHDGQILYLSGNSPFGTKQETFDG